MRELIEVLLSIGIPTAVLVGYALVLARREEQESSGETQPARPKRSFIPTAVKPDPDAHIGSVGTE